jgi:hypothetical protein
MDEVTSVIVVIGEIFARAESFPLLRVVRLALLNKAGRIWGGNRIAEAFIHF